VITPFHFKVLFLVWDTRKILWTAIVTVETSSHIFSLSANQHMNFLAFRDFDWLNSAVFLEADGVPFVLWVLVRVRFFHFVFIRFFVIDNPFDDVGAVCLVVVTKNAKAMEDDVLFRLETTSIKRRLHSHVEVIGRINSLESSPHDRNAGDFGLNECELGILDCKRVNKGDLFGLFDNLSVEH